MSNVQNKTTLEQSWNKVVVVGTVKENNLEQTTVDGVELIRGDMVIVTGDHEEHKMKCYAKKLTKKNNENPSYKSLSHAVNYVSMASAQDGQVPTRVAIRRGELRLNTYLSPKKEIVSYPELFFSFIETAKDNEEAVATFEVEGVLENISPEFDKQNIETGRHSVKMILFDYEGKALPFSFKTTPEAGAYMSVNYLPNLTTKVWGKLISTVEVIEKVTKGFGGDKTEKFDKINKEMLIDNGEPTQKPEGTGYDIELVKKALAERELMVEELKSGGGSKNKPTGFAAPSQTTTTTSIASGKW